MSWAKQLCYENYVSHHIHIHSNMTFWKSDSYIIFQQIAIGFESSFISSLKKIKNQVKSAQFFVREVMLNVLRE